jgi:S-sulfosulfanyl-L-cysteine sulfohydrolase
MAGTDLTILEMNDSHGYLDIHQGLFCDVNHAKYELNGGYSRIATIFNEIKKERSNT